MPIPKKWTRFTYYNVSKVEDVYGVYEIADSNKNIIYIGQGRLRTRLMRHLPGKGEAIPGAKYFRYEKFGSKKRAEQKEREMLRKYRKKHEKLPKYNNKIG